jgi:SAM-dependent methyltransferase
LCGSSGTRLAFEGLTLRQCDSCGLVWRPERDHSALLYEGAFLGESGYYDSYFQRAAQWRHEARVRLNWLLAQTAPKSLLEVGCAGGFFLDTARATGIRTEGIEPSDDGSRFAREQLNLSVTTGTLEEVTPAGRFDTVCAFHVLEHVVDPWAFLDRTKDVLIPDGHLAIEVPNITSARARRDGPRWFNLAPEHHCWHFSPATITRLLRDAGFTVLRWDTIFPRAYFRIRHVFSRSDFSAFLADIRCTPLAFRAPPDAGDYLRVFARVS